ncbi:hypothetical protein KIN20_036563, partial [Parelaphostrongylus tenuis]
MIESAYRVALDSGEVDKMVLEQGWLELEPVLSILEHCEDPELRVTLQSQFEEVDTANQRWQLLKRRFDEQYRTEMKRTNQVIPTV